MEGSGAVYSLDRMYQRIKPEVMVDNLGLLGMKVSSSFNSKLGSTIYFSIFLYLHSSYHMVPWKKRPGQFPCGR